MMTLTTKSKIEEARRMMETLTDSTDNRFIPIQYEECRNNWPNATPAWSTLKKYAKEAGLESTTIYIEWHSDGSFLAEFCGLEEGQLIPATVYFFKK